MQDFTVQFPVRVHCGPGALDHLAAAIAGRPTVLIHHPNAGASDALQRVERAAGPTRLASLTHAEGLPTIDLAVRLCAETWGAIDDWRDCANDRQQRPLIVAYGGGSTIDLAKAACHRPHDGDGSKLARWIRGAAPAPEFEPIELIAIPTTAGTGSEVTGWATLWDLHRDPNGRMRGIKRSLESSHAYPTLALIDGAECASCPAHVTRDSGLDALAHAIEAIWNRNATPVADALAVSAATDILDLLPRILDAPGSLSLRRAMSRSALMAGLAFSQTRTALAHALSYPLTAEQSVPHGLACAVWLPIAWELAEGRSTERDRLLRSLFPGERLPAVALRKWLDRLGVPPPDALVDPNEIDQRISDALTHPRGRNFIGARL
jgi:phosphonate metabolism-associated iron-containing alcohol dehydrogenase